jgi:hypothetical protein
MPSWTELSQQIDSLQTPEERHRWLEDSFNSSLHGISEQRGDRNVLFYGTAFLQKPMAQPMMLQITLEEINGIMAVLHGMDFSKGLTLIMHTPGGVINATETIVSYLRSKFDYIEVIVPTYAMSAGTMICLSANRIVMGRQSQLGPIDPQMFVGGRMVSAIAILDQFERAKHEINEDRNSAHLWAPILPSLGPALLEEANHAIMYSEKIVADWIWKYCYNGLPDFKSKALSISKYFSRGSGKDHEKKNHGRRIDRDEVKGQGLFVEDLEDNQSLQELVLTAYHLLTIVFEKSPASKFMISNYGKMWTKNLPE